MANLTTPNSPFTSRPSSRRASRDYDEDEEEEEGQVDNNNDERSTTTEAVTALDMTHFMEGDICDDDGIVLYSNRDVDDVAHQAKQLNI